MIKRYLHKIYIFFFSSLCFAIPFTSKFEAGVNIILAIMGIMFPFVIKKSDWKKLYNPIFILFSLICLIIFLEIIFLKRFEDFKYLRKLLIIIAVIISSLPVKDLLIAIKAFVFSSFAHLVLSCFFIVKYFKESGEFHFSSGGHINEILLGERPYVGFVYVISFCLSIFLLRKEKNNYLKYLYFFMTISFLLLVFIISARISILSVCVILIISVFYLKQKKYALLLIPFILLFTASLFYFNENLRERFFLSYQKDFVEEIKHEPRYHIWSCAYDLLPNGLDCLSGYGFSETNSKLVSCYKGADDFINKGQQQWFVESEFNTHNQFINFYLSAGIVVFLLFVLLFLVIFQKSYINYTTISISIAFFLFCLTENVLSRQMGFYIFAFFVVSQSFILSKKHTD